MTPAAFRDAMLAVCNHRSHAMVSTLGEALIAHQLGRGMPAYIESITIWVERIQELARLNEKPRPRRVIIESPYAHVSPIGLKANIEYARAAVRDSLLRGEAPIASHLLHTQDGILRDSVPAERAMGMAAGHAWFTAADAVIFYCDRGLSRGMEAAEQIVTELKVPMVYRRLGQDDVFERPR